MNVIKADPAVAQRDCLHRRRRPSNGGFIYIALKPLGSQCKESLKCDVRQTGAPDIINRLRPKLNRLPVAQAFLQAAQDLRIGGRSSAALYQYTIQSDNVQDLSHWGPILLAGMKKLPGFQDVNTDAQNSGLQELLDLRSPHRRAAWHHAAVSGQLPLRRLRTVGSLHHLHTAEPVLRGAGSSAALLAEPRGAEEYLSQYHGQRRDSAFHGHARRRQHHAAGHQSHQFVSVGHGVVQPCHRICR